MSQTTNSPHVVHNHHHTTAVVSEKFLDLIRNRKSRSSPNIAAVQPPAPKFHQELATEQKPYLHAPCSNSMVQQQQPKIFHHSAAENLTTFNICSPKPYMRRNYYIPRCTGTVPKTCNPASYDSGPRNGFSVKKDSVYRPVVIDGSNVAMAHGNQRFSWRGLELLVDEFLKRGLTDITIVLPKSREGAFKNSVDDAHTARRLIRSGCIAWAPARQRIDGERMNPYDDRFIIKIAMIKNGVIVSNDQYRDLMEESPEMKQYIKYNLLMFTVFEDHFLLPDDPLGRDGPTLKEFLLLNKKPDAPWDLMRSEPQTLPAFPQQPPVRESPRRYSRSPPQSREKQHHRRSPNNQHSPNESSHHASFSPRGQLQQHHYNNKYQNYHHNKSF